MILAGLRLRVRAGGGYVHNSTLQEIRTLDVQPLSPTYRTAHWKDLGFACAGQEASQEALVVKNLPFNAGDLGSVPGWGRPPGGGHGNPLVFLSGESHGQRSLVGYRPWGHTESDTTEAT